jgi:hypothetical protein
LTFENFSLGFTALDRAPAGPPGSKEAQLRELLLNNGFFSFVSFFFFLFFFSFLPGSKEAQLGEILFSNGFLSLFSFSFFFKKSLFLKKRDKNLFAGVKEAQLRELLLSIGFFPPLFPPSLFFPSSFSYM